MLRPLPNLRQWFILHVVVQHAASDGSLVLPTVHLNEEHKSQMPLWIHNIYEMATKPDTAN
jgi:hypothetical protein